MLAIHVRGPAAQCAGAVREVGQAADKVSETVVYQRNTVRILFQAAVSSGRLSVNCHGAV